MVEILGGGGSMTLLSSAARYSACALVHTAAQLAHATGMLRRDVEHGLRITLHHYTTWEAQQRMLEILQLIKFMHERGATGIG